MIQLGKILLFKSLKIVITCLLKRINYSRGVEHWVLGAGRQYSLLRKVEVLFLGESFVQLTKDIFRYNIFVCFTV
jgi:hypothetical protein